LLYAILYNNAIVNGRGENAGSFSGAKNATELMGILE